jgi:hypothetical protein
MEPPRPAAFPFLGFPSKLGGFGRPLSSHTTPGLHRQPCYCARTPTSLAARSGSAVRETTGRMVSSRRSRPAPPPRQSAPGRARTARGRPAARRSASEAAPHRAVDRQDRPRPRGSWRGSRTCPNRRAEPMLRPSPRPLPPMRQARPRGSHGQTPTPGLLVEEARCVRPERRTRGRLRPSWSCHRGAGPTLAAVSAPVGSAPSPAEPGQR